jgi:hypothetical protein
VPTQRYVAPLARRRRHIGDVSLDLPHDQHRNGRVGQNLLRFAAQNKGGHTAPPMRGHYDQVALLVFGRLDYSLPGVIVALPDSFDLHARSLGEPFDDGEFFAGEFDRFGVDDAGEILWNQTAWHCTVQRLGHRHSNDLSLHELGEADAVSNSAFAEVPSVGSKMYLYMRSASLQVGLASRRPP